MLNSTLYKIANVEIGRNISRKRMTEGFVHVKNLEKYHPKYKDRHLIWCKVYFTMIDGDPEFEMIDEIDKWRFLAFVMLELKSKKPVPLDNIYLSRKGFNLKKRPISKTLDMLHNFIEVRNKMLQKDNILVTHIRLDYNRIEYNRCVLEFNSRWQKYPNKDSRKDSLKYWVASVKTSKDLKDFDTSLSNYLEMLKVETWRKPKSGKTFFNNWRDFLEWKIVQKPSIPESTEPSYSTPEERKEIENDFKTGKTIGLKEAMARALKDVKKKKKK